SSTELRATVRSSLLTSAGNVRVDVWNPYTVGGTLASATFTIYNRQPSISSLSPASLTAGNSFPSTLAVFGSDFVSGAHVVFNGRSMATTFSSSTELVAEIPGSFMPAGGPTTVEVSVSNPSPSLGPSDAFSYTVL